MGKRILSFGVGHSANTRAPTAIAAEGQGVGNAGRFHAGNGFDATHEAVVEGHSRGVVAILSSCVDAPGGCLLGLEAEVDIQDTEKAADEQARADEEDAGESDLGDDQDAADPSCAAALAASTAGVLEGFGLMGVGSLESGGEAEENAGGEGRPPGG